MGKLFEMRLADDPFAKMLREEKTVEIRLYDEKRQEIKEGDEILFHRLADESNFLMTNVIALHRFNSFKELFSSDLFSKAGCDDMSIDAAIEYMYKFYTKEQEEKYGVLGIEICADEDLTLVLTEVKNEYEDCDISEKDLLNFARQLNRDYFAGDDDLNGILNDVYYFEEAMRAKGAVIEVGRQCSIYDRIINYLDINEKNAKRLYESFMGYHDCQAFSYLMNEYEKWITKGQRKEILDIAREMFIESVWEDYV